VQLTSMNIDIDTTGAVAFELGDVERTFMRFATPV
jgi:hypothetical protein